MIARKMVSFSYWRKLFLCLVIITSASNTAGAETPEETANRFLNAMGGAEVWRDAKTIHSIAINHHPQARLPYIQEYWYFIEAPKQINKLNNFDMDRMRAYTTEGGWSLVEGDLRPFSEERLENEVQNWSRWIYRKLHLLANNSEELHLQFGADGRLEFYENGRLIGWVIVDDTGAPLRHGGTEASDVRTVFDELVSFGAIPWPKSGESEIGWRFEMLSLEVSNEETPLSTDPPMADN